MSISRFIRTRRFAVKENSLSLVFWNNDRENASMVVQNLSLTGLRATSSIHSQAEFATGDIIPEAKLRGEGLELAIGRLVVKGMEKVGDCLQVRFFLIDSKLPVDESLSGFLRESLDTNPYDPELSPYHFNLSLFRESTQSKDLFNRCKQFEALHRLWEKTPQYQYKTIRAPSMGTRVDLKLPRKGGRRDFIVMGTNDYLNMAAQPAVIEAAKRAMDEYGFGSTGSPLSTGLTRYHEELSETLASIFRKPATLLFGSGYAANIGTIAGLVQEGDLLLADNIVHASVSDALNLSAAKVRYFRHNNVDHLRKLLMDNRDLYAGCMIVTEGVFSMDGDLAPLDKIAALAGEFGARLYVDEAHSLGVIGETGMGASEHFGVRDQVDILMGALSKLCGGVGGFVCARKDVIDWLYMFGRSQMFSVAMPPATAAGALAALKIFLNEPERLQRLRKNIAHFISGLRELGYRKLEENHPSAIIPVIIGDEEMLGKMNLYLRNEGVFVVPVVYPVVSRNGSRFRFCIMADHTVSDLDFVLGVLNSAMKACGFRFAED